MIAIQIPFSKNLKDNLHCFQAALKMVLAVLIPETTYSCKALEKITGYKTDSVTWDTKALLWLAQKSFYIKKISTFDYRAFAVRGKLYLKEFWRPDVYAMQSSQSNLRAEQFLVQRLVKTKKVTFLRKNPDMATLEQHLKSGWLAILHVDVSLFDRTKNYSPHSIVVTRIDSRHVFFHDPGLPPEQNRKVSREKFAKVIRFGELVLLKTSIK